MERIDVAVVGAGQAGLATSYWLSSRSIDHVLLERDRSGESWRRRWDSFCLVTPNWSLDLPGFPYDGDHPGGFIGRDEIVDYVGRYREFLHAPVRESTEVLRLGRYDGDWLLRTNQGDLSARSVVVATGAFPFPSTPALAASIHPDVVQLHSGEYRNSARLPAGGVLVVGSGQSGAQIVDDLVIDGCDVWFSIGEAGHGPRRYRGRDMYEWLRRVGFMDRPVTEEMRQGASIMVSGRDGGKDLNPRALGAEGVRLVGRVVAADGLTLRFGCDVEQALQAADDVSAGLRAMVDGFIAEHGIDAPPPDVRDVDWAPGPTPLQLDLAVEDISAIVWATGYHYDFSWIDADVFEPHGYPRQKRGVTAKPGLYFVGLNGMHTVASGLFSGVGADAEHIVEHLSHR